ncbi:ATP-binding protein [Rhizobium sp. MHM7A]|uniref:ATP-binding protein n=1 Tax=Rhizobium sp. MHM7A TaxID=2583233 RepID=UPI001106834F|nr:ATP-binding protein [Rhizobium sp. MHM7A]TLX16335.1 hypothetical protein FFR93_03115 [Rhizobium sp. MHM7A]
MKFLHTLRFQVTILLMIAMIGISIISVASHITYQTIKEMTSEELQPSVVFRHTSGEQKDPKEESALRNAIAEELFNAQKGVTPLWVILVIGGYVTLIFVCASFVAIVVGNMIARPLSILGRAIDSVDPRDVIPMLKEDGIYEDRETIKLINKLSEKVKLAMESRMRLVAAAGHDLRTPLTRMRLRCEFIEDDKQRSIWMRDVDELTNIANDAITLVKEEVNPEGKAKLRLDDIVKETVQDLQIIGHDIKLVRSVPCEVFGKALSLKRALSNLMVNAATHGLGAQVAILVEQDQAVILIVDNGPGIPANMIDRAFEPFFRANIARQKHSAGAGLGLAIVKEIITAHSGTVTLANRSSKGLIQRVTLPLAG